LRVLRVGDRRTTSVWHSEVTQWSVHCGFQILVIAPVIAPSIVHITVIVTHLKCIATTTFQLRDEARFCVALTSYAATACIICEIVVSDDPCTAHIVSSLKFSASISDLKGP